ncbi:hypothetical protein GCM10023107_05100 [Actinoplanes octamycinicus]
MYDQQPRGSRPAMPGPLPAAARVVRVRDPAAPPSRPRPRPEPRDPAGRGGATYCRRPRAAASCRGGSCPRRRVTLDHSGRFGDGPAEYRVCREEREASE